MWARKAVLAIRTAITGITSRLTTIENAGYQTASDVSAAIASAIGGITELEYLVVSTLPASGAKGVVYLVPHQHGTRDIYDEYIWVNNAFEKIGSTDVDLSQYLLKTDISAWAKASTKPTYTASEVGALPDTTQIPTKVSDLTNDSGFITGYTETDPTVPAWAKAASKPTYTAAEVGALPNTTTIPSKTSDLTNDSGFITGYTETDPTVPSWAKASTKPTYTAAEVGALPDDTVIPTVPTKVSAFQNDAGYLTSYTETDPTVPSWAKQSTKPSYTAAEVGALPNTTHIPTNTSDLTNDSGFITGYTETDPTVPAWAKASSKPTYTAAEVGAQSELTSAQLAAVNSGITAEMLFPTAQNAFTPYNSRCTIKSGGYVKVGGIVFIDVAIETASAAGTSAIVFTARNADLATLSGSMIALTIFNVTSKDAATQGVIDASGRIQIINCESGQTLRISGCYPTITQ